jgi:hypothetical protein
VRYEFGELPGDPSLARPVLPILIDQFAAIPHMCLVDTGSTANRLGAWIAEAVGVDLDGAPEERIVVGGVSATARHARIHLRVGGAGYEAPVTFCDPWPFEFGLLGQEGFLRFFRVTLCARDLWLDVEPEDWS